MKKIKLNEKIVLESNGYVFETRAVSTDSVKDVVYATKVESKDKISSSKPELAKFLKDADIIIMPRKEEIILEGNHPTFIGSDYFYRNTLRVGGYSVTVTTLDSCCAVCVLTQVSNLIRLIRHNPAGANALLSFIAGNYSQLLFTNTSDASPELTSFFGKGLSVSPGIVNKRTGNVIYTFIVDLTSLL